MGEIEFRRNKDTGILETYRDGEYIGTVISKGDQIVSVIPRVPRLLSNTTEKAKEDRYDYI